MNTHGITYRMLLGIIGLLLIAGSPYLLAQECPAPATQMETLLSQCETISSGQACTGTGAMLSLADALDSAAPLVLRLGTPDTTGLDVLLFSGVRLVDYVQGTAIQIDIRNRMGYNLTLRSGPGTDFAEAGIFRYDAIYSADGRDIAGTWLRILRDGEVAWIRSDLIAPVGMETLMALPVIAGAEAAPPDQQLVLAAYGEACAAAGSVALLLAADGLAHSLTLNDTPLLVEGGLLVMFESDRLVFYSLSGSTTVGTTALEPGSIFAEPALEELANPPRFPAFKLLAALPLEMEVCVVSSASPQAIYSQPDATSATSIEITAGYSLLATGYTLSADGQWWQLAADEGWLAADSTLSSGFCETVPEVNMVQAPATSVAAASSSTASGLAPDEVIRRYLSARVAGDGGQMQQLACSAWSSQAAIQAQSFRAMRAELKDVSCSTVESGATSATVQCTGHIETEYNGQFRQWPLGRYQITREGDAWRMCGEG